MRTGDVITNSVGIFISIVGVIVGLIFSKTGDSMIGVLVMLGIFLFIVIFFLISWRVDISAQRDRKIKENSIGIRRLQKDLNSLKGTINVMREVSDLRYKMSFLEKLINMKVDKKGVIDPRIVIIIIIIILIFIYLRVQGVI